MQPVCVLLEESNHKFVLFYFLLLYFSFIQLFIHS